MGRKAIEKALQSLEVSVQSLKLVVDEARKLIREVEKRLDALSPGIAHTIQLEMARNQRQTEIIELHYGPNSSGRSLHTLHTVSTGHGKRECVQDEHNWSADMCEKVLVALPELIKGMDDRVRERLN